MLGHLQQDKHYNEVSEVLDAIRENTHKAPKEPTSKLVYDEKEKKNNLDGTALKLHLPRSTIPSWSRTPRQIKLWSPRLLRPTVQLK